MPSLLTFALFALLIALTARLCYINWLGRAKFGLQELNPLWVIFDKSEKGTIASLLIFGTIWTIIAWNLMRADSWLGILLFLGIFMIPNLLHDEYSLRRFRKYPVFGNLIRCRHCHVLNEGSFCRKCKKHTRYSDRSN
mgnify:CR=1 FL=1